MNIQPNAGLPVNLGNPGEFTIAELAEMVLTMVPTRSTIVHKPLPQDDPQRRRPDISRARQLLRWEPKVALAEGLAHTIAWFSHTLAEKPVLQRTSRRRIPIKDSTGLSLGA
jgi:UDP-glucuronate decarboxylase